MERLTNEQAKQEAIKKAYLNIGNYNINDLYLDEEGYTQKRTLLPDFNHFAFNSKIVKGQNHTYKYRPFSLYSLETNNGWTRIEPDGSNLPKDDGRYKTGTLCFDGTFIPCEQVFKGSAVRLSGCTHYKPIEKELLPIY